MARRIMFSAGEAIEILAALETALGLIEEVMGPLTPELAEIIEARDTVADRVFGDLPEGG